jgi:tetratricopeptide (TPR) repeat protein
MSCRAFVLVALLLLAPACRSSGPSPGRIVVLGIDGLDPQVVDLLMSEDKMPSFARLRQEGAYGRLRSQKPLLSPIIWTTIATGKPPEQHGIGHFVAVNPKTGENLPVTSQMRKVNALWNIFSDAGRRVAVVGWWATWPAETVNGAIVSDHTCYHFLFTDGAHGGADPTGLIHPPALETEVTPLIRRPGDLKLAEATPFVRVSAEDFARPFEFNDDLSHFKWALATAESYRRIGLHLWQSQHPDVLMLYIEGVDSTSHLFGHLFRARGLSGELAAQQERFGSAVEEMYRYADRLVGEVLQAVDTRTTVVVLSDHGFELGVLPDDPSKTRDMRRVSERYHRLDGILYLWGNRIRPHARLDQATILDVAPTLLAVAGLGRAADMPGRVLSEGLVPGPEPPVVASYEQGDRPAGAPAGDGKIDAAILEHLKSLGYVGAESPKGERNLAALHFEAGRYEEAVKAYSELVQQEPDDGALRASLAGALGALGRYDEALEHLSAAIRLEPLNPEAYHNRAVIYERKGQRDQAIKEYQAALRYDPAYAPSREALQRLGVASAANAPRTAADQLAAKIAERAAQAARRGDYPEAMKLLDEAGRVAPRLALVHQYRANVAYLMGDREQAIAALKKALELDPGNALFETNLRQLEQRGGAQR